MSSRAFGNSRAIGNSRYTERSIPCSAPTLPMSSLSSTPSITAPIGLYDSGVGGLSVWQAVHQTLPAESLIYIADTAHVPYGEKSRHAIVARARILGDFFRQQGVKAIVVPCNTATAAAIGVLRTEHPDIPIIGIEPAVKPAAQLSHKQCIGVLATTGTLSSPRFRQLVEREAETCKVLLQPCPSWVMAVERGELNGPATRQLVAEKVLPLLEAGADVLVLGCTHFPFLLPALREVVGPDLPILETGQAVTCQLQRQLAHYQWLQTPASTPTTPNLRFLSSGDPERLRQIGSQLLGLNIHTEQLAAAYC